MLLDGPAAAAPARARRTQVGAGLMSPPPEGSFGTTIGVPGASGIILPSTLQPGSSFGSRYRIEKLLGEGGMGAVYKAYDTELDRTIALKLVRPELASSPQTMQRFKQELLLASRISHKNILRIHDLGDWNGVKFITMAFIEGRDLGDVLDAEGKLTVERGLRFTRQLCAALEAAHHEGVVHRDLKPQNILIDATDNIYITDFGLAKSLEAEAATMTRTGQILGTPRYMAPEQVEAKDVDHRADIYAAGLIMYEMFTGELPFRGDSAMQLMYQRVNEQPKDPRTVCPELAPYIARVILRCLEKDPAKRYQSAREILSDLRSQHTPMLSAIADSKTISIVIPKPKASWWLAVAAAAAIGIGGMMAIPTTRNWVLRSSPTADAPAKPQHYIAVLPLKVVGDDQLKYIADGVVDAVSAKLAGLKKVYVASAGAVNAAAARPDFQNDPSKVASSLGVKLLLGGTIQSSGDRIAITLTMNDVSRNRSQRLPEFSANRRDLLTLEDDIFNNVVKTLLIQPSDAERARVQAPTGDSDAYDLYLQGVSLLRGQRDVDHTQKALGLFDQAIKRDFQFALAFTGTADASRRMWDLTKDSQWADRAVNAALQAEQLNSNLLEAHLALGSAYTVTGKTDAAISELKLAKDLAPNSDEVWRRLGKAYQAAARRQEAIDAFTRATQINEYFWSNFQGLGAAYLAFGDTEDALKALQRANKLQPDNPTPWANMGIAYYNQGKWSESIAALKKAIELQPKNGLYYSNLGTATFFAGHYAEAVDIFAKAVDMNPKNVLCRRNLADAYWWSGQKEKAAAAYADAIRVGYDLLKVNPKDSAAMGNIAVSYAKSGDNAQASSLIHKARQISPDDEDLMYWEATINVLGGRMPEAIASIGDALRHGHAVEEAKSDPELKSLRETPEFANLLREIGLKGGK